MNNKIGIFFGTASGTTRLIAKKISQKLGDSAAKPLNVNRIGMEELLNFDFLILGTPTYGDGIAPGLETGAENGSWQEFYPKLSDNCLQGKTVALYGLGDQDKYSERFASGLGDLYSKITAAGAKTIGDWSTEGYSFDQSNAVIDDKFVGLVIDHINQSLLTDQRLDQWLEIIKPQMKH